VNLSKEYGYRNGQLLITAAAPASVLCGMYDTCGASPPEEIGPIGELESGAGGPIQWLVTDQLGTPRMIFNQSGSLAGVSRHDYLPFGEELFSGTGGRTTTQGYSATDSVRQKFTEKERDNETGLDYFGARYYASTQGRFTSPDKPFADQFQTNPQSWNTYSYVRNSPCNNVDAKGRCSAPSGLKPGQVGICIEAFIATRTFKTVGLGDNRSFSGDNEKLSARFRTEVIVSKSSDSTKVDISQKTTAAESRVMVPGPPFVLGVQGTAQTALDGAKAPAGAVSSNAITKSTDQDGLARVNVSTTAVSAFSSVGDFGSIRTSINLTINSNTGEVKRDQNSQASGYPSIAAYSYVNDGRNIITTTLIKSEEGSPDALKQPMKPLPDPKP
jgi:RHS repeat-associated protein